MDKCEIFMPGRLCLLGEHSDWASEYKDLNSTIREGAAIVLGLNRGLYFEAMKSDKYKYKCNHLNLDIEWIHNEASVDSKEHSGNYVLKSFDVMKKYYNVGGASIECVKVDLPIKKGLASSASICMAVVRVFNNLYDLGLDIHQEMSLAYEAERNAGSMCGKLDQICGYGNRLLALTFMNHGLHVQPIENKTKLRILLVDLNGYKDTSKILYDLNQPYLNFDIEEHHGIYRALGDTNQMIVESAKVAIHQGDLKKLGEIMYQAQEVFDLNIAKYSLVNLKAPKMHELLEDEALRSFIYGAKGVGSHGDGSMQLLLKETTDENEIVSFIHDKYGYESFVISIE